MPVLPPRASRLQDVEEGQAMQLPVWLAEPLAERKLVLVDVPRNYSSAVRNSLSADATSINLRDKSPNFYEIGLRLARMSASEDAHRLPASIKATLATRVRHVRLLLSLD